MKYVTIAMIARHAKKHKLTVWKALRKAGVNMETPPGAKGFRITEKDANRFLAKQWPEVGPLPIPQQPGVGVVR